ncbi:MAG TPA: NTP transferase domain-containing protein [Acidimicrobiia bacterium]|jgi:CTP:molybdopterin cytidylyltransferase MocA
MALHQTAALLLDTSPGTGFDGPKLLAPYGRSTLVEHVVSQALEWPVAAVVVVLGPDGEAVAEAVELTPAIVVIDSEWAEGSAAPLRVGLDLLLRIGGFDGALVAHADQPNIAPDVVAAVVERGMRKPMTVARYRYAHGAPYLVAAEIWQRLMGIEGDADLDQLLVTHSNWMDEVWVTQLAPRRVESPLDLAEVAPH